jgi:hypothetical protein
MLQKETVLKTVELLNNEFSIDELFEKISFIEKVEEGIEDSKNNRTITQEELKKEMQGWWK